MAKVLIVDDERSIRETLAEFVGEIGHEVFTAGEAEEALGIVARSLPDVVVCDIVLPGADGIALLERVQRVASDAQVIMITGEPTVETASDAVRQGAFDYLAKPVSRGEIQAAVESALRVKAIADERQRLAEENLRYREHLEEEVERKAHALAVSEEKYRTLVENANEAVFVAQDGQLRFANPKTAEITGYSQKELLSMALRDLIHSEDLEVVRRHGERLAGGATPSECEFRILDAAGEAKWVEVRPVIVEWEGKPATLHLASDVTARKTAQADERAREERARRRNAALVQLATASPVYEGDLHLAVRLIAETAADAMGVAQVAIWLLDEEDEMFRCVDTYVRSDGRHEKGRDYRVSDLGTYLDALGSSRVLSMVDVQSDPRAVEFDLDAMAAEGITSLLSVGVRSKGRLVGDVCFQQIDVPREWTHEDEEFAAEVAYLVGLSIEAAQRRGAEEALAESETRYRTIFEGSPISLLYEDFSQVKTILDALRDRGVDDLVGYVETHPELIDACIERIRVVDVNEATLALHAVSSRDQLDARLGTVLTDVSRRDFVDQILTIWEGRTTFFGTTVDRTVDGEEMHVVVRWSVPPGHEKTYDRVFVSKSDITATVSAERALRGALDGTIEAIGLTTEMRDPYTAGHQRRVTALAVAIAEDLGLDADVVDGIRAAGLMHDIGKMAVPAEILSKPSALTDVEMSLIRAHPRVAYDILRTVSFPWPVAEIVLQHHERIDGTGYPKGLAGDDVRLEAQVLAVADTVEAMASHRPYRAALGIDVALQEIEANRGTHYAPDVVDACLRLFREGGFAFPEDAGEAG